MTALAFMVVGNLVTMFFSDPDRMQRLARSTWERAKEWQWDRRMKLNPLIMVVVGKHFAFLAYCRGLVGNHHLTARKYFLLLPFQRQPSDCLGVSTLLAGGYHFGGNTLRLYEFGVNINCPPTSLIIHFLSWLNWTAHLIRV